MQKQGDIEILLEMVVTDFECDLFRAGYIQISTRHDVVEDESNLHEGRKHWHLLFPEVTQNKNNPVENNFNTLPSSYNQANDCQVENDQVDNINNIVRQSYVRAQLEHDSIPTSFANLFGDEEHEHEYTRHTNAITSLSLEGSSEYPMHNPSLQVMHKDEEKYDPQRIPSSVFERCDSLIPAEWSATSNESLFSLHLGTSSSLGKDQALLLSGELKTHGGLLPKSSEDLVITGNLEEIRRLAGLSKGGDDQHNVSNSTTIMSGVINNEGGKDHEEKETNKKLVLAFQTECFEGEKHKHQNIHSSNISFHSNASEDSNYSFAFPIFGDVGKNSMRKGHHHHHQQQQLDTNKQNTSPMKKGCFSCFHISSCISCSHCNPCRSCRHCTCCSSFASCFTSPSCLSRLSCWRFLLRK
ncbi:uncharacterized protein [Spinacia oleracea]|uniref:Uncharacterized protein isoform X2 n=1 Tax=Spinacia oleracea TaxID=3562 RepID=A0ABM3RJW1_SPIOL|nr:uncharacterized protein LOC130470238 isoform X2 [Spinacia oleracea]